MNKTNNYLGLCASGILACLSGTAGAASIFTDGFNAAAGNQNGAQQTTTLAVQFGANYDNWAITTSVGHQVDLNTANATLVTGTPENLPNPNNWAAMLLLNQVLTSNATIAANTSGVQYSVDFLAGPANYSTNQWSTTANGNGLKIEVFNGSGLIGSTDFTAIDASLASSLDLGLSNGNFTYTGDGTGDVQIRITGLGGGVFNGSIDNISVDAVPEPTTTALLGLGGLALILRRRK